MKEQLFILPNGEIIKGIKMAEEKGVLWGFLFTDSKKRCWWLGIDFFYGGYDQALEFADEHNAQLLPRDTMTEVVNRIDEINAVRNQLGFDPISQSGSFWTMTDENHPYNPFVQYSGNNHEVTRAFALVARPFSGCVVYSR